LSDRETIARADDHRALRIWLRLLTCTQLIERQVRSRLREQFSTTLPRFDLLAQLERHREGLKMNELSRLLMVTGGNVTAIVDQLEKEGLVERLDEPADRRAFRIRLTRAGERSFGEMARALMETQGLKANDIRHWVLHSAGRRVLDRARTLLDLTDAQMSHARGVLREFGNMSSATILFVLERMLREETPVPGEWGVMIGLGPGFAAEGALLRW